MKTFSLPSILAVCALRDALVLGTALALVQPCAGDPGGFTPTGSLNTARYSQTATLLPDGKVLVVGGFGSSSFLASAELFDPATGSWAPTGSLGTARGYHTATLLPNGKVLVAGGDNGAPLASAELFDPATGTWAPTGSLSTAREFHTATLLSNGTVLVAGGGISGALYSASAELYDPASGTWIATGSLKNARDLHTATLLSSGMVLVAGGTSNNVGVPQSAELYDPASRTWIATGNLTTGHYQHTATLLSNGMVLVAAGLGNGISASVELYNPASGTWIGTGNLNTARYQHTATLLPSGMVLVAGGHSVSNFSASAELYDAASGTWIATGSLNTARYQHTATLLPDGKVLVAGGDGSSGFLANAELYDSSKPIITSPLAAMGTVSLPFSYQFEATGATSLAVDPNTLPSGLSFDPALRAIVGNPTVNGTFQIGLSATNQFGTTNANLVLTVQPLPASGPVIMSVTSATGRTGSPFNFQVITSGGTSAARLSAAGLPAGLSADPVTGEISGTVTTDGSYLVTLSATEAGVTNTATLQLTFTSDLAVPVITSANSAFLFPGQPFSFTIVAPSSDTSDPVTYSNVTPLPPGLGLDPVTGIISGTPNLRLSAQPSPQLAGGVVTNTQIFACNSSGCSAQGILFLIPTGAVNISTRLSVGTGDDVLIGGFILLGNAPTKVVLRGIGPSLANGMPPVMGALADPFLELHSGNSTIASNDNWKDNLTGGSQEVAIENTGIAPTNDLESAILAVLDPGNYTAILSGHGASPTGVGLVEIYDLATASLDISSESHLANISTRGKVQTGDNVMIGGFINRGAVPIKVLVRAIGPSLPVTGKLADPFLELHNPDGTVVTNDNWKSDQMAEIQATTIPPTNDLESAIVATLPATVAPAQFDLYTAIVRGNNGSTGVALVEVYFGDPCLGTLCP